MAADNEALRRIAAMPVTRLALLAREMRSRTQMLASEPIAITGMGCRMPNGANSPEEYWQLLRDGRDGVSEVPPDRWNIDAYYDPDPDAPGKVYTRSGGFLNFKPDRFDAAFFGMSPREAKSLDPQQRLLLEVGWEALENAGVAATSLAGSATGVFVGISANDYANRALKSDLLDLESYAGTGTDHSCAAGRLSYTLGLEGPSVALNTACSSALVAIHLACQSLRNLECDRALAGAVNLLLEPENTVLLCKARMLSPTGRCRTFDAAADGYVRAEGCGMVVLRRLSDALADGDRILAVVRGSAVNQDGRSAGLTVPNGPAQQAVLRSAMTFVDPAQVDYVETHGTGTQLGDPIEMHSLRAVFGGPRDRPLMVGSVKSNIGHLESAAGIAGFIKVVLSLQHEAIPPHLHLRRMNPHISIEGANISIPTAITCWPRGSRTRLAGVSSFGFSGTNAHVVLEEAPVLERAAPEFERPRHILALSAKTAAALRDSVATYDALLRDAPQAELSDICYTANAGRSHFEQRVAAWGDSSEHIRQRLAVRAASPSQTAGIGAGLVFLFSGQGAQYPGMGRELYDTQPVFRRALTACAEALDGVVERPLLEVMYGARGELLEQTQYTQVALFALEWSLAEMWRSWGLQPAAVLGHSVGEFAAACAAGVMSWQDGLQLVAARGRLMQNLPAGGEMWAVAASEEVVRSEVDRLHPRASVAAVNAERSVVISGAGPAVREAVERLEQRGVRCQRLEVSHAFHSSLMEPAMEEWERAAGRVQYRAPQVPWIGNVTGESMGAPSARYWREQARGTVRYAAAMARLKNGGYGGYLEIGPGTTLIGLARQDGGGEQAAWLPSLRRGREDWNQTLESLATLYERGVDIDWQGFDAPYGRRKVALPTYPFQRERHWIDLRPASPVEARSTTAEVHPLVGRRLRSALADVQFESVIGTNERPYLADHRIYGHIIVPAVAFLEVATACATSVLGWGGHEVRDLVIEEPLLLDNGSATVQSVMKPLAGGEWGFELYSIPSDAEDESTEWRLHVRATISPAKTNFAPGFPPLTSFETLRERCPREVPRQELYAGAQVLGLDLGPHFQGIARMWQGTGEAVGELQLHESLRAEAGSYHIHPALLDSALQMLLASAINPDEVPVPVGVTRFALSVRGTARLFAHAQIRDGSGPDMTKSDFRLFDEKGQLVAEIEGLVARRAPRASLDRVLRKEEDDWLYGLEWRVESAAQEAPPSQIAGSWLMLADHNGVAERLAAGLRAEGDFCHLVWADEDAGPDDFAQMLRDAEAEGRTCQGVIRLWTAGETEAEPTTGQLMKAQESGCRSPLRLAQALARDPGARPPRLWLVTRKSQSVVPGDSPIHLEQTTVWGLAKSIVLEHPELACTCVDLDDSDAAVELLHHEIRSGRVENQLAFRDASRYAARLVRHRAAQDIQSDVRADSTYLITGGLGGLGLAVAEQLVEQGVRHLALAGRSAPGVEAAEQIAKWEKTGVQVTVASADVAREDQVRELLNAIGESMPPLRGVIHAAGVLDDGVLLNQSWERFEQVMAPKVAGAWNLHMLTKDMPLDHFILFSSVASIFGAAGQSNYVAANAFLDSLAHYRRGRGLAAVSINWGPWAETGLAARSTARGMRGVKNIQPLQGRRVFERLMGSQSAQVAVLAIRWPAFLAQFGTASLPLLSDFASQQQTPGAEPAGSARLLRQLEETPVGQRSEVLMRYLGELAAKVLGLPGASAIDPDKQLYESGMDSLMAVEIRNTLGTAVGSTLRSTLLFDYPTLSGVAGYLRKEVLKIEFDADAAAAAGASDSESASRDERVETLMQMSDEEVEAMLAGKLLAWSAGKSS
jgi:myxalamid-type polyketide synthase MxaC